MTSWAKFSDTWNQFWFAPASTKPLGLLRIFYGICLICKFTGLWGLERGAIGPIDIPRRRRSPISESGDMYRDPVPGFDWIPSVGDANWNTWEEIALFAAICWTVGLATKWAGPAVLSYFLVPMLHSRFEYLHHTSNYLFFLLLFIWLPLGEHYSLDRFLFKGKEPDPRRSYTGLRMIQVLLTWVYISTLFGKLNVGWFDGTVMKVLEQNGMLKGPFKPWILGTIGIHGLSLITLFSQGFFAIVVWTRWRHWAFLVGAMLHIGIDMVMNVTTFSFQMIALYICFIHPESGLTKCYFDSDSPTMTTWKQAGRLLNWLDRMTWVDIRANEVPEAVRESVASQERFVVERPDGTFLHGAAASVEVLRHLPLTFPLSFAMGIAVRIGALVRKDETLPS